MKNFNLKNAFISLQKTKNKNKRYKEIFKKIIKIFTKSRENMSSEVKSRFWILLSFICNQEILKGKVEKNQIIEKKINIIKVSALFKYKKVCFYRIISQKNSKRNYIKNY